MRMRVAIASALVATMMVPLTATPAEAASKIRFTYAQYDSPGSDTGSNASLNAEWVRIKNFSQKKRNLKGWTVRDNAGFVYKFKTRFILRPGSTVRIHTGSGSNTRRERYWGKDWYVWNNTGDRATLKNSAGSVVDRCSWGDGDGTTAC